MRQLNRFNTTKTKKEKVERYVLISIMSLLFVFIFAQFIVLNLAGVHGPEITRLRNEQEKLKLDNELKRAEINELTKSDDIQDFAVNSLGLVPKRVETVDDSEVTEVSAINK